MGSGVTVSFSGPLFDGLAGRVMDEYCREVEDVLGEKGLELVKGNLEEHIRVNRHVYDSNIQTRRDPESVAITDGWPQTHLVYGPWLEGVGSRNAPVTVFEGYWSFRDAAATLNEQALDTAQALLPKYLGELG